MTVIRYSDLLILPSSENGDFNTAFPISLVNYFQILSTIHLKIESKTHHSIESDIIRNHNIIAYHYLILAIDYSI